MFLFFIPEWATGFNIIVAFFGLVVILAGAIVVVLATRRSSLATLQIQRADAAEALVRLRDVEIAEKEERIDKLEEELESITAEHRALAGISIAKLFEFWGQKESIEAQVADLHREIRILKLRKDGGSELS